MRSPGAPTPRVGDRLPPQSRVISQELMNDYTFSLGIGNPIHYDAAFAARTEFGGPIASGPIALSLLDDALAIAYPGAWLRGGSIEVAFLRPVRPGDTISTRLEVVGVDDGEVTFDAVCQNQHGENVLAGKARLRPAAS